VILQRIALFSLVILAHVALLVWAKHLKVTTPYWVDIAPVELMGEAPIVEKKSPTPVKKVAPKPVAPPPKETSATEMRESSPAQAEPHSEPEPAVEAVEPNEATLHIAPPPSASYILDIQRTEPKLNHPYVGVGKIEWRQDGAHYTMHVEAGVDVLFSTLRLYSMDSEGLIGDSGVQPLKMVESRRGRDPTVTIFDYDAQSITFSHHEKASPLLPGAQDKATILMQLASIGHANPAQFEKGKEFSLQVAEENVAHLHHFVVLDQETITTPLGSIATWHIVRAPVPGKHSSRIDMWLAPEFNWLPVQFRNTESNGAVTTQTIRKIITGP
jgi:hypothetical protein